MPYTEHGKFCCPGCGAQVTITPGVNGLFFTTIELVINKYQEEESPKGNLRPDSVSAGTDAKTPSRGETA